MSQSDLLIGNQSFPATRAEVNAALQALAQQSAGPTEPATRYKHQLWMDESTGILKIRDLENSFWIEIGEVDQVNGKFTPLGSGVPPGAAFHYAGSVLPDGFLWEDGSQDIPRDIYPELFAAIGTTYGAGDGSTTFGIPDGRGVGKRGLDNGRGLDPGRVLGTLQQPYAGQTDIDGYGRSGALGSAPLGRMLTGRGAGEVGETLESVGYALSYVDNIPGDTRGYNLAQNSIIKF